MVASGLLYAVALSAVVVLVNMRFPSVASESYAWWVFGIAALWVTGIVDVPAAVRVLISGTPIRSLSVYRRMPLFVASASIGCLFGTLVSVFTGRSFFAVAAYGGAVLGVLVTLALVARTSADIETERAQSPV